MAKFVLIDHSIVDVGGHYHEYAVRVLRAAEEAGYEPVLATNRRLRKLEDHSWRVVPIYRYGFFEPGPTGALMGIRRLLARMRRAVARLKYRLMFSRLGVLWLKRRQGTTAVAIPSPRFLAAAILAELRLYAVRMSIAIAWLLAVIPIGNYVRDVLSKARLVSATALRAWRDLFGQGSILWQQVHSWRKRAAFAADTHALFREVRLERGDVVFIPTLAEADLLGLVAMFQTNPSTANAAWHLVFRRNAYQGRDPDFAAQEEDVRSLRNAFRRFQSQLCGQRVFFYTDTEPLTTQYNRLGVAMFRTLPIPVAADYRAGAGRTCLGYHSCPTESGGRPLHAAYIGDARTEKGYHWLPRLVSDAFARQMPVRFTFQSNFNVPRGEPAAVVARAQLEAMPDTCRVELVKSPLNSDEYRTLLLDADVVVIPYDRDNYYARSSGIFAEALVAGKPVIVPAGTWMASQLATTICRYHTSLREQCSVLATVEGQDLAWQTHLGNCGSIDGQDGLPVPGKSPIRSWLDIPADATHLLLSFRILGSSSGIFPGIVSEYFATGDTAARRTVSLTGGAPDGECTALIRIDPSARRIRLGISNALSTMPIAINGVRIDFFSTSDIIPASAVGTIYAEPTELFQQLREIANSYAHYRATAEEFSRTWSRYHCAATLLEQLLVKTPTDEAEASRFAEMSEPVNDEAGVLEAA